MVGKRSRWKTLGETSGYFFGIKRSLCFLMFIVVTLKSYSQVEFSGKVSGNGFYSNSEKLPFWFYSNQRGRISDSTNFSGLASGKLNYNFSEKTFLEIGGGLLYDDKFSGEVAIDELYADFNWKWLQIIAGRKQRKELYNGLSATNENFAWSLNSRPLPGIKLSTSRPLFFNQDKKLGIEITWAEYFMGNDRFVKGARLHSKSLFLIYNLSTSFKIKGGISHYAQWAGESSRRMQPAGFSDYLKIVTGREGGDNAGLGDQINKLGNHLGVYELYLTKKFKQSSLKFIYNHFFEMGSGSRFASFPDGRYGLFFSADKHQFIDSFIYEFYYTKNQSQTVPHLYDYYFNNYDYASGWTYQNRVIGVPFLTTNYYSEYIGVPGIKVGNNAIIAHHFGFAGSLFQKVSYKLLSTYRKNYGHYRNVGVDGYEHYYADDPRGYIKLDKNIFSTKFQIQIPNEIMDLKLYAGGDFSKSENNIGAGIGVSKEF